MVKNSTKSAWCATGIALSLAWPEAASAQTMTLGNMVESTASGIFPDLIDLVVTIAYLAGLYLVAAGIFKFRGFENRGQGVMKDGLLRLFAGSALLALPDTMGVGVESIFSSGEYTSNVGGISVGSVTDCLSGTSGSSGSSTIPMTCMAQNFATNFVPVTIEAIFGVCFIAGVFMVGHGFYKLAVAHNEGRAQLDRGWKTELLVGFILGNIPFMMNAVSSTMGFTSSTITSSGFVGASSGSDLLSYTPPVSDTTVTQYSQLIGYMFVIFTLFGVISFVQGWFILKGHADGSGRKTIRQGLTHMGAGIMLANAKMSICAIGSYALSTSSGFCS